MCPGEEENLDDMLDNHEFLLALGDGEPDLGMLPFEIVVFSIELFEVVLENPGLCEAIALGCVEVVVGHGSGGTCPFPLCAGLNAFSGGAVEAV